MGKVQSIVAREILDAAVSSGIATHGRHVLRIPVTTQGQREWATSIDAISELLYGVVPALEALNKYRVKKEEAEPLTQMKLAGFLQRWKWYAQGTRLELTDRIRGSFSVASRGYLGKLIPALQYIVEAFPREQLGDSDSKIFSDELERRGINSNSMHATINRLAKTFVPDLDYYPTPLYKYRCELGDPVLERSVDIKTPQEYAGKDIKSAYGEGKSYVVVRVPSPFFITTERKSFSSGAASI